MTRFLSPAYFSWICCEWWCLIKSSPSPATKRAGIKHWSAWAIGDRSLILKPACFCTELRIQRMAMLTTKPGTVRPDSRPLSTISSASIVKSANGLSNIMAAIEGSRSPWRSAVAAPIERPHRAIVDTRSDARRKSTTTFRSSRSKKPRLTYSPSDRPEPEKSKANMVAPRASARRVCARATYRLGVSGGGTAMLVVEQVYGMAYRGIKRAEGRPRPSPTSCRACKSRRGAPLPAYSSAPSGCTRSAFRARCGAQSLSFETFPSQNKIAWAQGGHRRSQLAAGV
mmetsp:Transcript_86571/g.244732  ORF Transcript_86571/g.244732 Transcript_86571/m.244732 type:complete len:284 (+) Transcript_86571:477-1328(+)